MLTLYHFWLCPASRAIRLALHEAGIAFELSEVKPWALARDFLNLNPAGTLPVLMADNKAICGAYPIVEYLAETSGRDRDMGLASRTSLWPGSPAERAEERRVADWFLRKFDSEASQYLLEEKIYKPISGVRSSPDLGAIRAGRSNLRYHLAYLSYLSEQRKWLGGDYMSFADLAAAAQLSVMDYLSEVSWAEFAEAKAWYARVKSRPAFRPLLADRLPGFNPPDAYANLDF
jgi:glutathione S-transferase